MIRSHNPQLLGEAILYVLYLEAVNTGTSPTRDGISKKLPPESATSTIISFAIEEYQAKKFVNSDALNRNFTISRTGYDYVRHRLSLAGSAIHSFSESPNWLLDEEKPGDDAPLVDSKGEAIPASDRIVKRSDNEENWANAIEGTKELEAVLVETNDHGDLSDEEYQQRLNEVRTLQIMLDAPQVQWEVLNQLAEKTVKYLAAKFADNAIGHAATGLITYLIAML